MGISDHHDYHDATVFKIYMSLVMLVAMQICLVGVFVQIYQISKARVNNPCTVLQR